MARFLLHWGIIALALAAAAHVVPGVHFSSGGALAVAALVLGFVNAVIRPVLVVLTLPITLVTLGLFYLIVNGVASLGSAVMGAIVVGVVSWAIGWVTRAAAQPPPSA
jgi:putative membrane protein